jgi:hypothetical protein
MVLESCGFTMKSDNSTLHLNLETSEVFLKKKNSFRELSFYFESKKHNK